MSSSYFVELNSGYLFLTGKDIHTLGESVSVKEFASTLAALSGKEVGYNKISKEVFLAEDGVRKNPHVGLEMWLNFKNFYDQYVLHLTALLF